MRPKRTQGASGRQAMWNLLRAGDEVSLAEMAEASGSPNISAATYMSALVCHGYVERVGRGSFRLVRNTGKCAPSTNAAAGTLFDWNLNPPMAPDRLRAIWQNSGLTLNKFGVALGLSVGSGTRLKQMIEGGRPISPSVEAAALAFDAGKH